MRPVGVQQLRYGRGQLYMLSRRRFYPDRTSLDQGLRARSRARRLLALAVRRSRLPGFVRNRIASYL